MRIKYKIFSYVACFLFFFVWVSITFFNIKQQSNTDNIVILDNQLTCDFSIPDFPSSYDFYQHTDNNSYPIDEIICILDKNYNGSKKDRYILFSFTMKQLNHWSINRPDIKNYFLYKIINTKPDDTLSLYIEKDILKN